MLKAGNSLNFLKRLRRSDEGGITIFGLYIFTFAVLLGGLGVDVSHVIQARTKLQVTADLAAHAALYNRDSMSAQEAKERALKVVANSMPADRYGTVLVPEDIMFGSYDYETEQFTVDADSKSAVLVTLRRYASNNNSVGSFLLQFAGLDEWELNNQAVFVTFRPTCLREGFVAEGVVDMQSNNGFSNGFCIHSNSYVSLNSNNTFEAGTVVSMPDLADLDLPNNGFEKNDGLETALREGRMHIRILNQLDEILDDLLTYGAEHNPEYITNAYVFRHSDKKVDPSDFVAGTMNYFDCNKSITMNGGLYEEIVIVAECPIQFGKGVILEDVTIFSMSTDSDSFKASSGLQVGRDDNCASGGGAQLITFGSMRFPSKLQIFGGQLIAAGNIQFAANANGIQGASMIAGEWIDGTSNMEMAFCGTGMENNIEANYFRMSL